MAVTRTLSTFTWAKVTATSPLRIKLDGDLSALPITPDVLIAVGSLAINDRVRVEITSANKVIVIGRAGGVPPAGGGTSWEIVLTDVGGVGNGSTNNDAAFAAAFAALPYGGVLVVPAGVYKVSSGLTVPAGVVIEGEGVYSSTITTSSATGVVFTFGDACAFRDISMRAIGVTRTADPFLLSLGSQVTVDRVNGAEYFVFAQAGTVSDQAGLPRYTNIVLDGSGASTAAGSGGIYLHHFADAHVDHVTMTADTGAIEPTFGIRVREGDTWFLGSAVNIVSHGYALLVDPPNGISTFAGVINGGMFDSPHSVSGDAAPSSVYVHPASGGFVHDLQFNGGWAGGSVAGSGVFLDGSAGTITGVDFSNFRAVSNGYHGIRVYNVDSFTINGGRATGNQNYGIGIEASCHDFAIMGVIAGETVTHGDNQDYGINLDASAHDYYSIIGNVLHGNNSAALYHGTTPTPAQYHVHSNPGAADVTVVSVPAATDTAAGVVELATTIEAAAGVDTSRAVTPAGVAAAVGAFSVPDATTSVKGKVELATTIETTTGTDTVRAVTPAGVAAAVLAAAPVAATTSASGIVELATSAETITGSDSVRAVTPAGLQAKVASDTALGIVELATAAETATGTDATRAVTPAGLIATVSSTSQYGVIKLADNLDVASGSNTLRAVTPAGLASLVATDTAKGIVELATSVETVTGTDATRAVTPASLAAKVASATAQGIVELATTAEATTGTDTVRAVTPAGLQAAITANTSAAVPSATTAVQGKVELATDAETATGTDTTRAITPSNLASLVASATARGIVELATDAETITGTDTTRAVTPANLTALRADTGWVYPNLNTGWTATSGETPAYRVVNGIAYWRGRASSTGANATPFFPALPAAVRPTSQIIFWIDNGSGTTLDRARLTTAGVFENLGGALVRTNWNIGGCPPYPIA